MPQGLKRFQRAESLHFLTFSCNLRLPLLEAPEARDVLQIALERLRSRHQIRVYAYVLMPEHAHLLVNEPPSILLAQWAGGPHLALPIHLPALGAPEPVLSEVEGSPMLGPGIPPPSKARSGNLDPTVLLATYSADPDPTQNIAGILNFYIDNPFIEIDADRHDPLVTPVKCELRTATCDTSSSDVFTVTDPTRAKQYLEFSLIHQAGVAVWNSTPTLSFKKRDPLAPPHVLFHRSINLPVHTLNPTN